MTIQKRTWFVTGSSTGLGRALVEEALRAGDQVVATARDKIALQDFVENYPETALALPLDVTDTEQAQIAVGQAVGRFGKIDFVVNNAGYGLLGAVEEVTDSQLRAQFETNVFGVLNVTRAFLPILRRQGHGHILQITTAVAYSYPALGIYNASKRAVEGFSESLAAEMKPFGINVTIVEPGGMRTDWIGRSMVMAEALDAYAPTSGFVRDVRVTMNANPDQFGSDATLCAQAILRLVEAEDPPLRFSLGQDALDANRQRVISRQTELDQWSALSTFASLAQPV